MPTDIFDTPPWDPEDTCLIVGSGPGLVSFEFSLADEYDVLISLNKAELNVPADYWFCAAPGLLHEQWFLEHMKWLHRFPFDEREIHCTPTFLEGPLTYAYPYVPYTFRDGGDINTGEPCQQGVLKHGGTVAGRAIQLAYLKGCKDITLAGIDQRGNRYFDDTEHRGRQDGVLWPTVANINKVIHYVQAQGCKVRSLTPTALDVEVI